jgi:hypothetical protein
MMGQSVKKNGHEKKLETLGTVAHFYNPSHQGGRDQEDFSWFKCNLGKKLAIPHLNQ